MPCALRPLSTLLPPLISHVKRKHGKWRHWSLSIRCGGGAQHPKRKLSWLKKTNLKRRTDGRQNTQREKHATAQRQRAHVHPSHAAHAAGAPFAAHPAPNRAGRPWVISPYRGDSKLAMHQFLIARFRCFNPIFNVDQHQPGIIFH